MLAGLIASGEASAQGKAPYPDVFVEKIFEEDLAAVLAQTCPLLATNFPGLERHRSSAIAEMSDRGHHARSFAEHFAPIQPERFTPLRQAFLGKHSLTAHSADAAFCEAGAVEVSERSAIGLLLMPVKETD
ncbi:MAG: hypothetical protein ABF288_12300 [Octadecabacter sp.]